MNKPVGYLVNHPGGLSGEKGLYYNYILASNGLFIEADNPLIKAQVPIAETEIRGLAPAEMKITLKYGSIPQRFFDLALNLFLTDIFTEHYVAVTGDAGYHFYIPVQDKNPGSVVYAAGTNVVLELHSHGAGLPFFSGTDNKDETGLKLYGVIGRLETIPMIKLRIGVYGYFIDLPWSEVFDGSLYGAVEYDGKEVINEADVQDFFETHGNRFQYRGGGMWWNRWFRR